MFEIFIILKIFEFSDSKKKLYFIYYGCLKKKGYDKSMSFGLNGCRGYRVILTDRLNVSEKYVCDVRWTRGGDSMIQGSEAQCGGNGVVQMVTRE